MVNDYEETGFLLQYLIADELSGIVSNNLVLQNLEDVINATFLGKQPLQNVIAVYRTHAA
jgi:hypothetical protein